MHPYVCNDGTWRPPDDGDASATKHGKLRWMHLASTEMITHLEMHDKRGSLAHEVIGILPQRTGCVMHDGYRSYDQYP